VPSTIDGTLDVFAVSESHLLHKVNGIKVSIPIDNLSVDKKGDIYAATLPKAYKWTESSKAPFDVHVPSAVYRIRKPGKGYEETERKPYSEIYADYVVEKVIEDDGSVISGATIAVHDAETGRIFLGGAMSPFITICQTKGRV
jgi:arylesterase/paraoxonase